MELHDCGTIFITVSSNDKNEIFEALSGKIASKTSLETYKELIIIYSFFLEDDSKVRFPNNLQKMILPNSF